MTGHGVIQMTLEQHNGNRDRLCAVSQEYLAAGLEMPMSPPESSAYDDGFTAGWRLATMSILRDGCCRFEVE